MSGVVERVAARGVAQAKTRLVRQLQDLPGLRVTETGEVVVVEGRRLKARWLTDPRLRWLGGWW